MTAGSPSSGGRTASDAARDDAARDGAAGSGREVPTHDCRALAPLTTTCGITRRGTSGVLLEGDVLAPDAVYLGGHVLWDASGVITCVGCACADHAAASDATSVTCPAAAISPGLINTHDHLTHSNNAPASHEGIRYRHRHEWRTGARGSPRLTFEGGATANVVRAAELRFVMGGATATVGAGSRRGLLRNLDTATNLEGARIAPARPETFPLDDTSGLLRASGCAYGAARTVAADLPTEGAFVAHVAEGIDVEAQNELECVTAPPEADLVGSRTTLVHAMAVNAKDAARLRHEGAVVSWSPRSNVDLYGNTTPITLLDALGVTVALGTDWIVTGSANLLRELACADFLNRERFDHALSDFALWQMVTTNAALAAGAESALGALREGRLADVVVFDASERTLHRAVIGAQPADVVLVLRSGQALYGNADLAEDPAFGGRACERLDVCGTAKSVCLTGEFDVAVSLAALSAAAEPFAPLFSCEPAPDEPSCVPARPGEYGEPSPLDLDADGVEDSRDLCPRVFDPPRPLDGDAQADVDADGQGDACDRCPLDPTDCAPPLRDDLDGDGVPNAVDVCPRVADAEQRDADGDGHGDACDPCPIANPGVVPCRLPIEALRDPNHPSRPSEGAIVTVEGLWVTAVGSAASGTRGFFAQRASPEPFGGIFVYTGSAPPPVTVGQRVTVTGRYVEYFGLTELTVPVVTVEETLAALPFPPLVVSDPATIATGGALAEGLESMLVVVRNVVVVTQNPDAPRDYDELVVTGGLRLDDALWPDLDNTFPPGAAFTSVAGVVAFSFGNAKLLPRGPEDLL